MGEGAAGIGDHPGGDEFGVGIRHETKHGPERQIFRSQLAGRRLPLQKMGVFLAQPQIFIAQHRQFAKIIHPFGNRGDGSGKGFQDGGNRIRHLGPQAVDHDRVGLADQHQAERSQHKSQISPALNKTFQGRRYAQQCSRTLLQFPTRRSTSQYSIPAVHFLNTWSAGRA